MNKTTREQRIDAYVAANRKDPILAFFFVLLCGPLGLIAIDALSGVVVTLIMIGVAVTDFWPLNTLIWFSCAVSAPFAAADVNKKLRTHAELITPELGNTPAGLGENKARS